MPSMLDSAVNRHSAYTRSLVQTIELCLGCHSASMTRKSAQQFVQIITNSVWSFFSLCPMSMSMLQLEGKLQTYRFSLI